MENDDTLSTTLEIPANKVIVLNLNGHTLTTTANSCVIENNGSLTVKNGSIIAADNGSSELKKGIVNNGTLTVDEDSNYTTSISGYHAITNYGTTTVNDGKITTDYRYGIWSDKSTSNLTVNGGQFTSNNGSGIGRTICTDGTVMINGGTFESKGSSGSGDGYVDTIRIYGTGNLTISPKEGSAVSVTSSTDYAISCSDAANLTINGGTFKCEGDRVEVMHFGGVITINGGTFYHEPDINLLPNDRYFIETDSGYVVLTAEYQDITVKNHEELIRALSESSSEIKRITIAPNSWIEINSTEDIDLKRPHILHISESATLFVDGILRLNGTLQNEGDLVVGQDGFIENVLQISNEGEIREFYNGEAEIYTPMDLQWLAYYVEQGEEIKKVTLTSDIIIPNNVYFTPIGNSDNICRDIVFDGKGHFIKNLYVNSGTTYGGLFGTIMDSYVHDLTIKNAKIVSTSGFIGVLAGIAYNTCTFEGITIVDSEVNSNISYGVGGMMGSIYVYTKQETPVQEIIDCHLSNVEITGYANTGSFWGTSEHYPGTIGIYNSSVKDSTISAINVNAGILSGYGHTAVVKIIGFSQEGIVVKIKDEVQDNPLLVSASSPDKVDITNINSQAVKKNGIWSPIADGDTIVALLNSTPYVSFTDALNDANDGDVIKLMKSMNNSLSINKPGCTITIDLNGYSIIGNDDSSAITIIECNDLYIEDSSGNNGGKIEAKEGQYAFGGDAHRVSIFGGTIIGKFNFDGDTGLRPQIYGGIFSDDPNSCGIIGEQMGVLEDDGMWHLVPSIVIYFYVTDVNGYGSEIEIPKGSVIDPSQIPSLPPDGEGYHYYWMANGGGDWDQTEPLYEGTTFTGLRWYTFEIESTPEKLLTGQDVTLSVDGITYSADVRFDFSWIKIEGNEEYTELGGGINVDSIVINEPGTYFVDLTIRFLEDAQSLGGGYATIVIEYSDIVIDGDESPSITIPVGPDTTIPDDLIDEALEIIIDNPIEFENSITLKIDDQPNATISISSADKIVDNGVTLVVSGSAGLIKLESETVKSMIEQDSDAESVTLSITKANAEDLKPAQQNVAGDLPIFELSATIGDSLIHNFDGTVSIELSLDISAYSDPSDIVVFYIDDAGSLETMPTDCSSGKIVFKTTHFSYYIVGDSSMIPDQTPVVPPYPGWDDNDDVFIPIPPTTQPKNDDETAKIVACAAASVAAAILLMFIIADYRKK